MPRRARKSAPPTPRPVVDPVADAEWVPTLREKETRSLDGTRIAYQVVGEGERVLLLANGLGGRLYAWQPLIDALWRTHRLVTWDYRGLFDSDTPEDPGRLAVHHHVEDALALLEAEAEGRAVLVGWSMGTLVSLDLAARHPSRVAGLVLLNGLHGHVFSTGFQPLFTMPGIPRRLHATCEWVRRHPGALRRLARVGRFGRLPTIAAMAVTAGRRAPDLHPMLRRYFEDVLGESFENYVRLFQELDAHSVYHLLPEVRAPALVIAGALDVLTPPRQSREMAERLPDAEYVELLRATHFALLERPEAVVPRIQRFLAARARW